MNDKTRKILSRQYGFTLARYDKAKREGATPIEHDCDAIIGVLRVIFTDLLDDMPINWDRFDNQIRRSPYYHFAGPVTPI